MYEFGTRRPCRWVPGARRSTPLVAPRLGHGEKAGTRSSASVSVPWESDAPTASRSGSDAGLDSAGALFMWRWNPLLPPDATTTMPCFHACSAAKESGSTVYDCVLLVP